MRLKALLLSMLVFIGMISGVYATWVFTETAPVEQYGEIYVNVNAFNYTPEAVLPSDPEADKLGQNHLDLIKKILYEASYGLNATKKPIIHNLLNKTGDVIYCEQNVQGGNLKHLMIDGTNASKLLFQIEYISDTSYFTYTYRSVDAKDNPLGTEIEVYKTLMSKTGTNPWTAVYSYIGTAKTMRVPNYSFNAIDSSTWK